MLEVLSYGAGKQTFAILVLIEQGKLPHPDLVIFADTQNEKEETYKHIEEVAKPICDRLGIEFVTISKGNLYDYLMQHQYNPQPPKCTMDFKVRPINSYLKKRYGFKRGFPQANLWIGISTDEAHRTTPSKAQYVQKSFPLLDLELSRTDCIRIIRDSGYPEPPKSGCTFCPHNYTKFWRVIKEREPQRFAQALALEDNANLRKPGSKLPNFGPGLRTIFETVSVQQLDMFAVSEDLSEDDNCSTGYCMI